MKLENKESICGPKHCLLAFTLSLILSSYTKCFGYYEITDSGRPTAAYSICCCKKEGETSDQVLYSCQHVEGKICPEGHNQYDVPISECPNSLMFKKHEQ